MSGERRRWILAGIGVLLASTVLPLSAPTSALTPGVESVSDPRNDVANGGGDIVSASAVPKADGTLTVTIEVDDYEDPLISRAWTTGLTAATWEFDTNGDGNVDHTAVLFSAGSLVGDVYDAQQKAVCSATPSALPGTSSYRLVFDTTCIGNPRYFEWRRVGS